MSKKIADGIARLESLNWQPRQSATAAKWAEIVEQQHLSYSRHGGRTTGAIFNAPFVARDADGAACPDNANLRCTTEWNPVLRLFRASQSSGDGVYRVTLQVYGHNVAVDWTLNNPIAVGDHSDSFVIGDEWAWGEATIEVPESEVSGGTDSGRAIWLSEVLFSTDSGGVSIGDLVVFQIDLFVSYVAASEIPTNPSQWAD